MLPRAINLNYPQNNPFGKKAKNVEFVATH